MIRFQQPVIRPREAILAARGGARVWADCADTVASKIYGPHLEDLAREWTLVHANEQTLGGPANQVRPATIACPEHKTGHELDVVALADLPHAPAKVLAIGEAKATEKAIGDGELARLDHLRKLIPADKAETTVKLLLFSGSGFTSQLRGTAASRADVELIDTTRPYHGD